MTVTFVIPTHDNPSLLRILLKNMTTSGNRPDEVVVVSDLSGKQEAERRVAERAWCKFIPMQERSGFAKTVNEGVRASSGDVVVLVNTDILFLAPCVNSIVERFQEEDDLGVLGFKLLLPNGKIQHAGGYIQWTEGRHLGRNQADGSLHEMNRVHYPVYVTGALYAFRRTLYDKLGGFDEKYVFGCEDADFCIRAWLEGFAVRYQPTIEAIHSEGMSRNDDPKDGEWVKIQWEKAHAAFADFCIRKDASMEWNVIYRRMWEKNKGVSSPEEWDHIIIIRTGMTGDVVLGTTKLVHAIKRKYPDKKVYVRSNSYEVFANNPDVAGTGPLLLSPFGRNIQMNTANGIFPKDRLDVCHMKVAIEAGLELDIDEQFLSEPPRIYHTEVDENEVMKRAGLKKTDAFAVIHQPVTNWKNKDLPDLVWAEVQHGLKLMGLKVVVVGKKQDHGPMWSDVIDMRGRDNIQMLHALIENAAVFVGVDSAPFHVCQCTATPGVVVFTAYPPELLIVSKNILPVRPTGCKDCYARQEAPVLWIDCPEGKSNECAKTVSAESILARVREAVTR